MKKIILFTLFCVSFCCYAQVGINTTNPNAQLDIRSSNQVAPTATDGMLIPKVDTFPAVNPTNDQQGMLVFLTTAVGGNQPGFYYWNNPTVTWVPIKGNDTGTLDQAYDFGGAGLGRTITADAGALVIDGTDGIVSIGTLDSGSLAPSGAGVKMFWNPRKSAFRAGRVTSDQWDDINIGSRSSVGFGENTIASGNISTAFGVGSTASGFASTVFGQNNVASGSNSFAFGFASTASALGATVFGNFNLASGPLSLAFGINTTASGNYSTALGRVNTASGDNAFVLGINNTARSFGETVIGVGATNYTLSTNGATQFRAANITDRLFVIGNAIDANNSGFVDVAERSDAMIVLKNGLTRLPSMNNTMIDAADGKTVVTKEYLQDRSSGTLDQAYDFGGAGLGRTITADAGAVTIAGTDGLVSSGTFGSGAVVPSGTGTRMVWNPRKGAFRAGVVSGTQWDDANIGAYSIAFGGNSTASGDFSTALTAFSTASGEFSTASGYFSIASGAYSTSFGLSSGSSGSASTAFGHDSVATGDCSTAFGRYNSAISYGETVIGVGATWYTPSTSGATQFRTANATDRLFVVGNAIDTNNNNLVDLSERSNALTILKNGNVALGNITPTTTLDIDGQIRIRGGNPAAGRLLISDADGTASWQNLNVTGWSTIGNTGLSAATNFMGTTNAIDVIFRRNNIRAGRLGTSNTSFGVDALNPAGTGGFNTAVGVQALRDNTTGGENTAIGYNALALNLTGSNNTAAGRASLQDNIDGSDNTAYGYQSLRLSINGNSNTAVGRLSLQNSTGNENTSVGRSAGSAITSGNNNTAVGFNAQVAVATNDNQVRIGNTAVTLATTQIPWTTTSDRRWKNNILPSNLGLDFIKNLKPVYYTRLNDGSNKTEYGFIAQEMDETLNRFGASNNGIISKDDEGMYGVRYNDLIAPMVKAMQEQQQVIEQQNTKIATQQNEIDMLKFQLQEQYNALLKRIEKIENP